MLGLQNPQFPSHLEKNKDKEWIQKYIKACYDDFTNINTNSFYAGRDRYANINKYMIGKQDTMPNIKSLGGKTANQDKSNLRIPKNVLAISSKYARMMVSTLSKAEWSVDIQAIDPTSIEETTEYYADAKARMILKKEFEELGLNPKEFFETTGKEFEDEEDLDLYMEYSYKHRMAIEAEQAIRIVLNNCDYGSSVRQMNIKQLVYYGFAGVKDYFDQNGDVKTRFVDVNNFIVSRCMYSDFRDAMYMGEVLDVSIADLKEMDIDKEITEEQYQTLAKKLGAKSSHYGSVDHVNPVDYEMYRVKLADIEAYSTKEIVIEKGLNKIGNLAVSTKSETSKKLKDNEYETKDYKVVYEGKWVVGTDIYLGCKLQTNMKRPKQNLSDVKMSYQAICPLLENMETKGLGEDMIPIQNMIQLIWTKYENAIIKAKTKGVAIEMTSLENIPLGKGGESLTPPQMLQFFQDTGNLVYRKIGEDGKESSFKPIQELENGIGDEAMRWFRELQSQISLLQQITGYNDLTDGSTPEARTLNGVAKQAAESTNNSIDFMKQGERKIYEALLFSLIIRIQDAAKQGKLEGYINALGKSSIEFFKLSPEVSARELGLTISDAPDAYQKESLQRKIDIAIQSGQITLADAIFIENIPIVKHAEAILSIRIKKNEDRKQKINLENIAAQSKQQQDSAAMSSQLRQQEVQLETQAKMSLIDAEKQKELELIYAKGQIELQLKQMEVSGRVEGNRLQSDAKIYSSDRQSKTKELEVATTLQNSNLQKAADMEHEKEMNDVKEDKKEKEKE